MRLLAVFLIVLAGMALRLDAAWQGAPVNQPDSAAYERIARGLHEDGAFIQKGPGTPAHPQPATNYSPGLPLAVAGVFTLAGDDDTRLARILLALAGTLAIIFAWLLARRLAPPEDPGLAGLLAAAAVAFYPCLIADAGMLLTESLAGTLITGSLLAVMRARDRLDQPGRSICWRALDWLLPGLLFGLTAMVRPEYLLIGLLLIAVAAFSCRRNRSGETDLRRTFTPAAVMVLAMLLVISPWALRNLDQSGRVLPLSTGGGQTLFTGSYLASAGDPLEVMPLVLARNPGLKERIENQNRTSGEGPGSITPERVLGMLAAERMPGVPTDIALARMGRENYLRDLRSDPLRMTGYLAGKAARIWWRGRTDLTGNTAGKVLHVSLVAGALIGLILLGLRRRPEFWLVIALALGVTLIGALLVASPRRTLALWPVIASLCGVGFTFLQRVALEAASGRSGSFAERLGHSFRGQFP